MPLDGASMRIKSVDTECYLIHLSVLVRKLPSAGIFIHFPEHRSKGRSFPFPLPVNFLREKIE
jgi:hypothetical protein